MRKSAQVFYDVVHHSFYIIYIYTLPTYKYTFILFSKSFCLDGHTPRYCIRPLYHGTETFGQTFAKEIYFLPFNCKLLVGIVNYQTLNITPKLEHPKNMKMTIFEH